MSSPKKGKALISPYLLVVIGVFLVALIAWQFYKYKLVNRNVNKAVSEKTKGLYSVHYDGLNFDEVSGVLHVKNIEIMPDTAVYNQLVEEGKNPPMLIRLTVPALDILGVKTPKALLTKQIEGSKVEVSDPTIGIELDHISKDSTMYNPGKDLYKQLLGNFLKIQVDSVEVIHARVLVSDRRSKEMLFSGKNVSFLLSGLLIDSLSSKDSSRILFSRNLDMDGDEISLPSKNKKYRLHVEKIRFTGRDNSFYIGSLRFVPQLSESEFAASFPTQKDRYDFVLEGVSLRNVNREAIWHKRIEADSLIINKSSFKIFHDLSYPRDTASKVGKYPQQQLMRLAVPLIIKKMVLRHSFIEYKEKNAKSDSAGKVQFFDVSATVDNVTNLKSAIARNNRCVLSFKSRFLNKAPANAKLVMLLGDPHGKFNIKGDIGSIDVVSLNPLTQPMGLARMEKGNIDKLHFDFSCSDSSSDGKLEMLYNGLKVSLLKKDKEENKYDKKGLASFAANIIIKGSNPGSDGKTRIEDVHFKRFMNRSMFNLIWKTIFTGIKQTAGLK